MGSLPIDLLAAYALCVACAAIGVFRGGMREKPPALWLRVAVFLSLPIFLAVTLISLLAARAWDPPDED